MELVVHGQSIKTTVEYPFFVPAQGKFVAAGELRVGEQLVGHDGKLVQIESIGSTGEVTTVYNLRVADFHTYFVGGGLWGFDVCKEQKRTGTAIRNSAAQASRLGMLHASVAARYQLGGMAGGALVGYGTTGSIDGALMGASFGQMGGSIAAHFAVACFTAGTPLVVDREGNSRPIDEIEVGDFVLARSEFDPNGPLELKRVEEKFVRTSVVMEMVVHGQSIKTTAEHPFFVPAQGKFVAAGELQVGEQLVGHDGKLVQIESIGSTGEVTTVYNLRVADFHTCFVGGTIWGWDVWVHNASYSFHASTDASERLQKVVARIGTRHLGTRTRATSAARSEILISGGLASDDAGHLLARILGGRGGKSASNIVAINSVLNRVKMAQFESRIAEYIRTNSVAARISASVDYVGRDGRPSQITYGVLFSDGTNWIRTWAN